MNNVERVLLNYNRKLLYNKNALNVVGATKDITLRTITAHSDGNCKYVRKFGTPYLIKQVTDMHSVPSGLTIAVTALDGTLLGLGTSGGFTPWTTLTTAQGIYLVVTGGGTLSGSINIDTDVGSGFVIYTPTEAITSLLVLYVSATGSTYYDSIMQHGGARHTPIGTQALPYYHPIAAGAACDGSHQIVTILDSAIYDGEITMSGNFLTLQAALGQTPTITAGIGARYSREVIHDGNNTDTIYVSKTGSDVTGTGTWQKPYATIGNAIIYFGSKIYLQIMDSAVYNEAITMPNYVTIEPVYGAMPSLQYNGNIVTMSVSPSLLSGFIISNGVNGLYFDSTFDVAGNVQDCTFSNLQYGFNYNVGGHTYVGTILRNKIFNCATGINLGIVAAIITASTVHQNIIYGCQVGVFFGSPSVITISNNLIYGNDRGIWWNIGAPDYPFNAHIINNTICNNGYGFIVDVDCPADYTVGGTIDKNIFYYNSAYDLYCTQHGTTGFWYLTITNSDYGTSGYAGPGGSYFFIIGSGTITTDPLMAMRLQNVFGLAGQTNVYKGDGSGNDMGCQLINLLIGVAGVTINGIMFNGYIPVPTNNIQTQPYPIQNTYLTAIGKTGSTYYAGTNIAFCTVTAYQGNAIDDYVIGAAGTVITNNQIYNCLTGGKFAGDSVSMTYNIFYGNLYYGAWLNGNKNVINHNVFFGNFDGVYFDSGLFIITFKNNICYGNLQADVFSLINLISLFYNDIGSSNSFVNIADSSNLQYDPLFDSTDPINPDFRLRAIQAGYVQPSFLLGKADDGFDMGALQVTYSVSADNWSSYQFAYNPKKVTWSTLPKGLSIFENALGSKDLFMLNFKRQVEMDWEDNVTNQIDREKVDYFHTLQKNRIFSPSSEIVKFRVHMKPTQFEDSGTGATVNAGTLTLADTSKSWNENAWRGFSVGIQFYPGTNLTINATGATATDGSANWTTDQWAGYYLCINSNYFQIISNTSAQLTLTDYNLQLVTGTLATYAIEKYFHVNSNTMNVLNLDDPNGELVSGTFDWYIDFMEMRITDPQNAYFQEPFALFRQHNRGGYKILFEEL